MSINRQTASPAPTAPAQVGNPGRIIRIRLAARHIVDVPRIAHRPTPAESNPPADITPVSNTPLRLDRWK
jgi:hypothetical protein